jgi:hypothetical protein
MSFVFVYFDWLSCPNDTVWPLSQCLLWPPYYRGGPGSSVGIVGSLVSIATELRAGRSRDQIPVGARFSTRPDWPWDPPSLLYNGYWVFPGDKLWPGRAAAHSPPSSQGLGRVELYLYLPLGHNPACNGVTLPYITERCGDLLLLLNYQFKCDAWRTVLLLINTASTMPTPDLSAVPSNGRIHKCHSIMRYAIVWVFL